MLLKLLNRVFFISLFLISSANAASALKIENTWSPEAPPVAKVMAGYMKITNMSDKEDRKSTRLNSSHITISYAAFCLTKKITASNPQTQQ